MIEVTIAGEPLQDWNRREIEASEERIEQYQQQIDQIRVQNPTPDTHAQIQIDQFNAKISD